MMKTTLVKVMMAVITLITAFSLAAATLTVSTPTVSAAVNHWSQMDLPTTLNYQMLPDSDIWDLTAADDGTLFALVEDTTGAVDIMDGGSVVWDGLRWAIYPGYSDIALFKSTDGGYNWTLCWHVPSVYNESPIAVVPQPGYVDSDSANDVVFVAMGSRYISGDPKVIVSYAGGLGEGNIYRSMNGGAAFTCVTSRCPGVVAGGTITSLDVVENMGFPDTYMAIVGVSSLNTSTGGAGGRDEGVYSWNQNCVPMWNDLQISNSMQAPPRPGTMQAGWGLDVIQVYASRNYPTDGCIVAVANDIVGTDYAGEPAGVYVCFYDANDGIWGGDIDSPTTATTLSRWLPAPPWLGDYAGAAAIDTGTDFNQQYSSCYVFIGLDGCANPSNNDVWRIHGLATVTGPSTVASCNVQVSGATRISDISIPGVANDAVYVGCDFPSDQAQVFNIANAIGSPVVTPSSKPPSGAWPVFVTDMAGTLMAAGGGDGSTTSGVHRMVDTPTRGLVYNGVGLLDDIAVSEDIFGYVSPYYGTWCLAEAVSEEVSPTYDTDGLIYVSTYSEWVDGLSLWRLTSGNWERVMCENINLPDGYVFKGKDILTNMGDNIFVNDRTWWPKVAPQFSANQSMFLLGGRDSWPDSGICEQIWYSSDKGDSWTALPHMPIGAKGATVNNPPSVGLSESGWCVVDSNTLFVGDVNGWVYKTTNRGTSWSDGALTGLGREIDSIVASPIYNGSGAVGTDKCLLVGTYNKSGYEDEAWLSQDGAVMDLENVGDELYVSPVWGTPVLGNTVVNFDQNWATNHIIYAVGGGWLDRWQLVNDVTGELNRISFTDASVYRTVVDLEDPSVSTWEVLWGADDWNSAAPQPQQYSGMALGDTTCRTVTPSGLQIGPDGTVYVAFSVWDNSYNNPAVDPSPKSAGRYTYGGVLRCLDGTLASTEWEVVRDGLGPWHGLWLNRAIPGSTHLISLVFDWKDWCFKLAQWESFTLTYDAGAHGSITGTTPQVVNYGADGSQVRANPDNCYHFVDWSDSVTTAVRTDTNVTGDITVTANFAINTSTLTASSGSDGRVTQKWMQIPIPDTGNMQLAPNTDVGDIAVSPDGATLFSAVVVESTGVWSVYKSVDGGYTWKVTGYTGDGTPTEQIVAIDISPAWEDDDIIVVATTADAYYSEDRGKTFTSMGATSIGTITSMDVALDEDGDATYVVGTNSDVYILGEDGWEQQYVTGGAAVTVLAVAFSPNYGEDGQVFAIITDGSSTTLRAESDITVNNWGSFICDGHFVDKGTSANILADSACMDFADDYNSVPAVFVGLTAYNGSESRGDAFRIDLVMGSMGTSAVEDLNIRGVDSRTNVNSLAVSGPASSAYILAGLRDLSSTGPMSSWQRQVHYSNNGGMSWLQSYKPPSGFTSSSTAAPIVIMAPDFEESGIAYCSNGYIPGDTETFSGFYVSTTQGTTWNGRGLLELDIDSISDIVPSPDYDSDNTLFVVTRDTNLDGTGLPFGFLWETQDRGFTWELILGMTLSMPLPGVSIDRIEIPATYPDEPSIFVTGPKDAQTGAGDSAEVVRSTDEGNLFATTILGPYQDTTPLAIDNWVVIDKDTLIVSNGSDIYKTTDMGAHWYLTDDSEMAFGETVIDMQIFNDTTVIVGTNQGNVYMCENWEADFSFLQVGGITLGGDNIVQVAFDTDFDDNGYIYAGVTDAGAPDTYEGIWRTDVNSGDDFEQIYGSEQIYSIACDGNGMLWAIDDDGIRSKAIRCVNPTDPIDELEFEYITNGLTSDLWSDLEIVPTQMYVFAIGGTATTELWTISTSFICDCGTVQNIVATPNRCYHFVNWTGDTGTIANVNAASTTITMNGSYTIQANFAFNGSYTLTYTAGVGGTVNNTTPQTVVCGGNGTTVRAAPNASYVFVRWSDSVTTANRTDTNVQGNITVIAIFQRLGGGGGGGGYAATTSVGLNILGGSSTGTIDSTGRFQGDVDAASPDGNLSVHIAGGTEAFGQDGNPLIGLNITTVSSYPPPPDGRTVLAAFNFQPSGATFNPAIQITITYDPSTLPAGTDESQLVIAFYDEATGQWKYISGTVHPDTNTITFPLEHFTVFGVMSGVVPSAAPTVTPTPTPEATIEPAPTATVSPTPTIEPTPTPATTALTAGDSDGLGKGELLVLIIAGCALLGALVAAIVIRNRKK